MSLLLLFHGVAVVAQPAQTVPLTGYVYGTPASGTVTPTGGSGLVIVSLRGVAAQVGDTGYPGWAFPATNVATLGFGNQALGGVLIPNVEALIGRAFSGFRENQALTTTGIGSANNAYDLGYHTYYRSVQVDQAGGWASVSSGAFDAQLTTLGNNLKNSVRFTAPGATLLICFHHEQTVDNGVNQIGYPTNGTQQQYINFNRYCRLFWDALGVSKYSVTGNFIGGPALYACVGWDRMWVDANGNPTPTAGEAFSDFDPDLGSSPAPAGTSYYQFVGSDVYNSILTPGTLKYSTTASKLLEPIRAYAAAKNKDWMIGEFGCEDGATTADHTNKAAWLDSARVFLDGLGATSPGVCRVLLSTVKASAENYNVDSSAESLAAWQRLGRDVYYA